MFWDPYFGWDWHMIRSWVLGVLFLCAFASFVSSTEGLGWTYPYSYIYGWIQGHTEELLITIIISLVGIFYFWKVQMGDI
tara:strand:+ start:169 stop:408 length:240 start_codon:yes stop_codon:yes gene_type:complete